MTFGTAIEKQIVMRFATATARDAAILVGSRVEGMVAYVQDVDLLTVWNGATWVEFGGKRQRAWEGVKSSTASAAMTGAFISTGTGLSIANAPIGDWLITMSLSLQYTVSASGNVRLTATTNGVTSNLNNDAGIDMVGTPASRQIVSWMAPLTTTVVSTLAVDSYVLAGGSGNFTVYQGSRVGANYLGPR
jgi:hypothetical protein